jgi:hypothetical protein
VKIRGRGTDRVQSEHQTFIGMAVEAIAGVWQGSRLCENSARYNRTRNFEACGHAQSKKNAKIHPPPAVMTKSDFVFTQPGSMADLDDRRRYFFACLSCQHFRLSSSS